MRSWRMISLLLVSLLVIHEAQGRSRKLAMTPNISSATNTVKNDEIKAHPKSEGSSTSEKIARKAEKSSADSSSSTEQRQPETYPDILDIAGMDYSQARRKPPIHN